MLFSSTIMPSLSNIIRINLLFLLSIFILGCTPQPVPQDTLVIGASEYPQNLDPRLSVDAMSSKVGQLIYNGLFVLDDELKVQKGLVEKYEQPDLVTLKIKLKDGVFFHNQKKLTSKDVVATFKSIINPKFNSPHQLVFQKIKSIQIINDLEFVITLNQPFSPFLTSLTIGILPEEIANGTFQPIGTGPYRLIEAKDREKIVLESHQHYFDKKPILKKIELKTIYDDTLRTLELYQGRLDLVQNDIPQALLSALLKKDKQFIIDSADGINFQYIGFNFKDAILKNKKVRHAIALGINRQEIVDFKKKGMATLSSTLLSKKHWAYNSQLDDISYNPALAKKLLDEAGYEDPPGKKMRFKLVYKTSTKKDRVEMALLIKHYLKQIGIELDVKTYEWGTFFRDIRSGNFQMYSLSWVGVSEPDIYYYAFHSSMIPPNGANRGFYVNSRLDNLLEEGRVVSDKMERKKIYDEVQQIVFDDWVYIPMWHEKNYVVSSSHIHHYQLRTDASYTSISGVRKK